MHCSKEGRHIKLGTRYSNTALSPMVCAQYRAHTPWSCWEAAVKVTSFSKNPLSSCIPQGAPVLFSLKYSSPASFHTQPPIIPLFLLIHTEDCGSQCFLEQAELRRLQIKHCAYLLFFRRFTISFDTKSQVKPPNVMVCVITWVKQSSDCWLCPAYVIRIAAIPLCQLNTID